MHSPICNLVPSGACRATFTPTSVEVRVVALQGKNYIYTVKALYLPINADGCHVAASKTKKNVLITLQVPGCRHSSSRPAVLPPPVALL